MELWNITYGLLRTKKLSVWLLRFHLVHCDQNNMHLIMQQVYKHACYLFGIWKKHRDESEVHTSLLYKLDLHLGQNKMPVLL